jgi:hypothetical protein
MTGGAPVLYGRDEVNWERLVAAGLEFLKERARLRRLTSYTELNQALVRRTRLLVFDFGQDDERAAVRRLLGRIWDVSYAETGVLISALVPYLNASEPGSGLYELAVRMGLIRRGLSPAARQEWWAMCGGAVFAAYSDAVISGQL